MTLTANITVSFLESRDWPAFPVKGQIVNILGFVGHTVFVTTAQLCCFSMKAVIGNMQTNGCDCVPIKLYLQKRTAGRI